MYTCTLNVISVISLKIRHHCFGKGIFHNEILDAKQKNFSQDNVF